MYRFFFFAFLLICFYCSSEQGAQSSQLADGICKCYQPLIEINEKAQGFLKRGQGHQAEGLITEMGLRNKQAKSCTLKLTEESKKGATLDTEKLKEAIEEKCPTIWTSVNELLFE